MNIESLKRQFAQMGAVLEVELVPERRRSRRSGRQVNPPKTNFWLDVREARQDESFVLTVREDAQDQLDFLAVDVQPRQRHLLLLAKRLAVGQGQKEKFLCGHDERHWFVAGVPTAGVINVVQALEALKPGVVIYSQQRQGVRSKDWHKRRNAGFIRQGEWFFLPRPEFRVDTPHLILRHEPIRRSGGQAHLVEELFRLGGETVYVSARYPNGLTQQQYKALLNRDPRASQVNWQVMRRNSTVFARGKVRHPDHQTIVLPFWHQVVMNGEVMSQNVVFLD